MKSLFFAASLVLASMGAQASCVGTGSFRTCTDSNGSTYNVQRYGNTTQMQGYNTQTGNTWNQTTQTYGNTTYQSGNASNGNSWNGSTQVYGGTTVHSGTDSSGNSYYKTCTQFGCN